MKIALVTETFPPEINGVARTLERTVTGLVERGHDLSVIRPKQGKADAPKHEYYSEYLMPGCPVPRYPGLRFGWPAYFKLKKLWRSKPPERVHVATEGPLGVSSIFAANALNIPIYSSFHTNFHTYGEHYGYGFLIQTVYAYLKWVHNRTSATLAPAREVVDSLQQAGFKRVHHWERGVDTNWLSPEKRDAELRESWGAGENIPVVLYVGRVASEKNMPLVFRAVREMQKVNPELKLVVVGDGPEKTKFERDYPDFTFAGPRTGEDLARHYASGDFFLFGSLTETFGNVITEAMGSGLLVLTYDYAAGNKHICHGENGFLVPYNHEDALIEQAVALLSEPVSKRDSMRKQAREDALGMSWEKATDKYMQVLNIS